MQPDSKHSDSSLTHERHFLLFSALYKFIKESPGIAFTLAYLVMILTSTSYLYFLFDAFHINIIKFITLEDLLVAPIKNPGIILVFLVISLLFYLTDFGAQFRSRQKHKYAGQKMPFGIKALLYLFWTPESPGNAIRVNLLILAVSLTTYIFVVASWEAKAIKRGEGAKVVLTLTDDVTKSVTLLGTSSYFVLTYDHVQRESSVYSIEVLHSLKPVAPPTESKASEQ